MIWGGSGERWDLLQLQPAGPTDGGDQLRQRIRTLLNSPKPDFSANDLLSFAGETVIEARGAELVVQIDADGRSWAPVATLLERYQIPYVRDDSCVPC